MPDVYVNGRFLTQRVTGVQRFGRELLHALGAPSSPLASDDRLRVLVPSEVSDAFGDRVTVETVRAWGGLAGHAWEQTLLRRHVPRGAALASLTNTGPVSRNPHVLVVHDAAVFDVPHAFSWRFRTVYQAFLGAHASRGTRIVTVSRASRERLAHHLRVAADTISVVPEGVDHVLRVTPDRKALERFDLGKRPYVLGVSSLDPRKNFALLERLAEPLAASGIDVVVAGGGNPRVFPSGTSRGSVRYLGFVSDEALVALYRGAACFVHPSVYEGFGLTPLEAMLLGAPVVASDVPVLRETLGDAAVFADPRDDASFHEAIRGVIVGTVDRSALRERGLARARGFTWRIAAERFWNVVRSAVR